MKFFVILLFTTLSIGCDFPTPDPYFGPDTDQPCSSEVCSDAGTPGETDIETDDVGIDTDAETNTDTEVPRPRPTVAVNPEAFEDLGTFDSIRGEAVEIGGMRSTSSLARFPVGEILLSHTDTMVAQQVADRWNGEIVDIIDFEIENAPKYFTIVVDPSKAPFTRFDQLVEESGLQIGSHTDFSSEAALGTFIIALVENVTHSLDVSPNYLFDGQTQTEEVSLGTGIDLAADKSYLESGGIHDMGVTDAWRLLAAKNRLRNKVAIMIIDGGFVNEGQLPNRRRISGEWGQENPVQCSSGPCLWHGTNVAAAAMGRIDGVVTGPAAPVAELYAMTLSLSLRNLIDAVRYVVLGPVADRPDIINMSFSARIPAIGGFLHNVYDGVGMLAKDQGIILVASAGNDGIDVDEEDCFLDFCWEAAAILPCESDGVICVGQLELDTSKRINFSNFGSRTDDGSGTVEIYATAGMVYGKLPNGRPDLSKSRRGSGTSFASPIVAGIVALMRAANPELSAHDLTNCLLNSAHVGGVDNNGGHQRRVHALGAVKCALGKDLNKPTIRVLSTKIVNNRIDLRFVATDNKGEVVGVDWSAENIPVGSGRSRLSFTLNQGRHYLRGRISGGTSTSFSINVKNNPPHVIAYHPQAYHTYYENEKPVFITFAEDEPGFRAENLCWKFSVACHGGDFLPNTSWFYRSQDFFKPGIVGYEAIANDGIQTRVGGSFRILPIDPRNTAPTVRAQVNSNDQLGKSSVTFPEPNNNNNQNEYRFTASAWDAEDGILDGRTMYWTRQRLNGKVEVLCDGGQRDCSDFTVRGLIAYPWGSRNGQTMVTVEVIDSRGATRQAHVWVGGKIIQ